MKEIDKKKGARTSFVFRIGHECLLHGFRSEDFVFFFNCGCGCCGNFLLSNHFEGLNHWDVAESLGNGQGSLTILKYTQK